MKRNEKKLKRKERGITLIALVITIIVLLILAGVSIAMLTGENGILTQAQRAKTETENAATNEQARLDEYNQIMDNWINGGTTGGGDTTGGTLGTVTGTETSNTTVQDSLGNKVVVPAGFKVINPEDNVEDGIIIEDVNHGATAGSQFVWIPVGTIHRKDKEDITIKLSRYTFDGSGISTDQGSNVIESYFQELTTSGYENTTAKEDIESEDVGFRKSAIDNGGYYIGRYEARTANERTANSDDSGLTQLTLKPDEYIYNYVTQPQAATLSRNMYSDNNFESDLINSYAWDTAIVFIQECSGDTDYSRQNSLNTGSLANKGTNNLETKDQVCNIYDMASNCWEWTTETYRNSVVNNLVVRRGGSYSERSYYTAYRYRNSVASGYAASAFRPLLYL